MRPTYPVLGASKGPGIRRLTLWVIVTAKAPAGGRLLYPASAPAMLLLLLLPATAAVSPRPMRGRRVGGHLPGPHVPCSGGSPRPLEPEAATQPGGSGGRDRRELGSGGTPPPTPAGSAGTPTAGIPGQGWAPRKLGQRFPSTCWSSLVPADTPPPRCSLQKVWPRPTFQPLKTLRSQRPGEPPTTAPRQGGRVASDLITTEATRNLWVGLIPVLCGQGN